MGLQNLVGCEITRMITLHAGETLFGIENAVVDLHWVNRQIQLLRHDHALNVRTEHGLEVWGQERLDELSDNGNHCEAGICQLL